MNLLFNWNIYVYNTSEWIIHAFISFVAYVVSFTCIMNFLEKAILKKQMGKNEKLFVTGGFIVFIVTFIYILFFQ